jgi:hypothetical protein
MAETFIGRAPSGINEVFPTMAVSETADQSRVLANLGLRSNTLSIISSGISDNELSVIAATEYKPCLKRQAWRPKICPGRMKSMTCRDPLWRIL